MWLWNQEAKHTLYYYDSELLILPYGGNLQCHRCWVSIDWNFVLMHHALRHIKCHHTHNRNTTTLWQTEANQSEQEGDIQSIPSEHLIKVQ